MSSRPSRKAARNGLLVLSSNFEMLERRQLLSAAILKTVTTAGAAAVSTPAVITYTPPSDASLAVAGTATHHTQYKKLGTVVNGKTFAAYSSTPSSSWRTPTQIRKSYGVNNLTFGSVAGDGTGQAIAVIDAYDDANMVSSTASNWTSSDLYKFDAYYGLNQPTFHKVNSSGVEGSYPANGYSSGWTGETALDVEYAHAMAPNATLYLVEATNDGGTNTPSGDNLEIAMNWAKNNIPNLAAISMSYDFNGEFSTETAYDADYVSPAGKGVTFLASSGDDGSKTADLGYSSYSPNVVAVGGTVVSQADSTGTWSSEIGWDDSTGASGGGTSIYAAKPGYQNLATTTSTTKRTIPDVSIAGGQGSGVATYDTSFTTIGASSAGWSQTWGTSLSSPMFAGLIADADQGRALLGLSNLDGRTSTLPRLYELNSADYHDITAKGTGGMTTYNATAGYDLVTGLGTPIANKLIPDLAGGATVSGSLFIDANGNGVKDAGESAGVAGQTVYLDINNDGVYESANSATTFAEPTTTTDANGNYSFSDVVGGRTFAVRTVVPTGYVSTTGGASQTSATTAYGATTTANFGLFPTSYTGSAFTLRTDAAGNEQIFTTPTATGTPAYSYTQSKLPALTFTGTSGKDTLNIDLAVTSPIVDGTTYNGNGGSDTIVITGSSAPETVTASGSTISALTSAVLTYSNVATLSVNLGAGDDTFNFASPAATVTFDPGSGNDTLNIQSGAFVAASDLGASGSTLAVNVQTGSATFNATQHLGALTVYNSAKATVGTNGNRILVVNTLSLLGNGTLDLTNNDALIHNTSMSTVTGYVTTARDAGAWDGAGLTASAAKPTGGANSPTGLGILSGTEFLSISPTNTTFDGQSLVSTDTLVKYTYNGDADFNGVVNANDYGYVDSGYQNQGASGFVFDWFHGNFNFDSKIDANDYALIDSAYQLQTDTL